MNYILRRIVQPVQEPVTVQEAKDAARITTTDFDSVIPGLIKAGREHAEAFQNCTSMTQPWELIFDSFPMLPFEIPKQPLQSLESVVLVDSNGNNVTVDKNDFIVSARSGKIGFKTGRSWPNITLQEFDSVIFTFKAGNTDISRVPESVKLAIKLFVCENIDRPDDPQVPKGFYDLLWPERTVPV